MRAIIWGISGQCGSYLAELLLGKGYEVWGVVRRTATPNTQNIRHIQSRLKLVEGDITDGLSVHKIMGDFLSSGDSTERSEVYNLAAQSHVHTSFSQPHYTTQTILHGVIHLLESIKGTNARLYNASSSEMYGNAYMPVNGYNEESRFEPQSPYAIAKLAAHQMCRNYREAYGLFVCNGIVFNNESPRRGEKFVTQKIARYVGQGDFSMPLKLGNINAKRDWGHSQDTVRAMHMMLQYHSPDDYVVATGETYAVRDFLERAFQLKGLDYREYVEIDESLKRPNEVHRLLGDSSKIQRVLGWKPLVSFDQLVREMVFHEPA